MAKTRVYELAKELNISSRELIDVLSSEFSITVKNHMSVLDEEDAELIKEIFGDEEKSDRSVAAEYEEPIQEIKKAKNKNKDRKRDNRNDKNNTESDTDEEIVIEMEDTITVKELADKLNKPTTEVIKQLMFMGVMAAINQELDLSTAEKLAEKFNAVIMQKEDETLTQESEEENEDFGTQKRPPVVTVMGHVDHGKTSILDAIRKEKVTSTEAGGITQHIGAYTVEINGEKITFLDTPGHEAFTTMRARGAQVTDIVILVVAADDGIMPQTVEAINHCKAAEVPIIVAINKIDKPGANIERVKQELTEHNLIPEDWGGDVVTVPVSAHTKEGLDSLLEMIILTAEVEELKADPERKAKGTVIEAKLDKGRGPVASLLVQNGTLKVGDSIIVGNTYGRIRAMFDDKGKNIKVAGPSIPVEILGLSEVPAAGDRFNVVKDEKTARNMADKRKEKLRAERIQSSNRVSLEDLYNQIQEGKVKELDVIVKADVQGSVEAVTQSLEKLSTDSVKVRVIHGAVGAISETDVTLSAASNAIIIGFNVRPSNNANILAEKEGVNVRTYRVIYDALDDIKAAMVGMLEPEYRELVLGSAEVRAVYKISSVGTIAGCYVLNGKITRDSSVRIIRDGIVIFETEISSLKRFKDDAKEVAKGYECGLSVEKFNDIKEGDIIEAFTMEEIKPKNL
ncbi:translation initiation factor IF-2 [Clostridium botulinum]|uniref:Translation initiation factor IF-2 n=1 Tax=Clostridium botulinum C/D str. DC5 TaxID=1443128 RepID=A0A0A0ICC4_CLOBO|nr:translation initiation factor IF-2 [Clostridium botulinum]KEI01410.1 translation initiation factor IF-2 [Clostridium botulinum C/D str. BKT75002]KEI07744.1 translation initiation factor IF-2 [Clostridium botulinum C/D str. BKT2873]KGM94195.1 translation initiation factor IF-2 [Clostridium botulinum D str. CCUG 7971]KGM99104.1 translation initiation factor IF-2 [Clostridium botulinum C/D str. DC5]KOC45872.1 translation initiation factor IF-2 [Clostridium botulinum]